MENQKSLLDRWLRPLGVVGIIFFGIVFIFLSFAGRLGTTFDEREKRSLKAPLIYAASFAENWFYDLRTARFYHHDHESPNIVILEINDETLTKVGRWPWSRVRHAKTVDNLLAYGAKVVIYDVAFSEPESPAADKAFADAIDRFNKVDRHSVVLSYGVTDDPESTLTKVPDFLQMSSAITGQPKEEGMPRQWFPDKNNFVTPAYQNSTAAFGFLNAVPDLDGVFRSTQLVQQMEGVFLPTVGFKGWVDYYTDGHEKQVRVESVPGAYELKILSKEGEQRVQLNPQGEFKIRFYGGEKAFFRVPMHEVILDDDPAHNEKLKAIFNGRAVLIGSSAIGANDLRHTPVDSLMPGMYMHANLFHALDQHYFYKKDDSGILASYLLLFFGIIGVLLLSKRKNPLMEALGTIALTGIIYAADYFYFAPNGYFIRLFFVLNSTILLYAWFTVLNVFSEAREKKKIRDAFSRYVAPEVVKEMLSNPDKLRVGGEKKEITMLFSDVRGFTTISERLTPTELANFLNFYMGKMTDILFDTGGTLDKYIGDALVGFWGAPLDLPDHAYHAVRGAKLMLETLPSVNAEFEKRKLPKANIGIGLNTGEVTVGNMGSDKIFQYTALGDPMNLASRIESLTKKYGVNLMISEFTLNAMGARASEFKTRPLDLVAVVGKTKGVKIYEVIPSWNPWSKEDALLAKYTEAYEQKFLKRQFSDAKAAFEEVLQQIPDDKATKKLLEQTEGFLAKPPPDSWDGTTIMTEK